MRAAGGRRQVAGRAACVLAWLLWPAVAQAAMQFELTPRLTVSGGGDDNVLFDGRGGDAIGRSELRLSARAWDRRWSTQLDAGAAALGFAQRGSWVLLGESNLAASARVTRHLRLRARGRVRGADDPLALAQVGLLAAGGRTLAYRGGAEVDYALTPRWTMGGGVRVDGVTFLDQGAPDTDGLALGGNVAARFQLSRPLALVSAIESRVFLQSGVIGTSAALMPGVRYRLARRTFVEAAAGPLAFFDERGAMLMPAARAGFQIDGRRWGAAISAAHDLSVPSGRGGVLVGQLVEAVGRTGTDRLELRARGGIYRSHPTPRDPAWVPGYGLEASAFLRVAKWTWLGVSAMRFERLATGTEPAAARDAISLRIDLTPDRP